MNHKKQNIRLWKDTFFRIDSDPKIRSELSVTVFEKITKMSRSDGAQIIPPHDKGIAAAIDSNLEPWAESWTLPDDLYADPLIIDPTAETDKEYNQLLANYVMNREKNQKTNLRFTYTPG